MQIRCPNCHNSIDVVDDAQLSDLTCQSCGSRFSLVPEETETHKSEKRTIGHFQLLEHVGTGSFGTVWKARDSELDRTVAIKIPRKGQLDASEAEQFLREARAAAQLNHPNIVSVHEVGRDDNSIYIVSDFVEGLSLADWLTAKQMTPKEAARRCIKIADALHHAHEAGVTHRDVSPSNVMLDAEGEPYVMDFGLAKRDVGDVTMTVQGRMLGTPAYTSPEQAQGDAHRADRRSDIYSLGVILFELLTGERPFRGNQRMLLHQVIHDEPPSPRKLNNSVPRDLETICLKCLRKDPDRRYAMAADLAEDLKRYLDGKPIKARPVGRTERAWRWCRRNAVVSSLTAVVLLLLAIGVVAFYRQGESRRERLYIADMNVAAQSWQEGNISRVREILQRHVPGRWQRDLRQFEWSFLWRQCEQRRVIGRRDLPQVGASVSFSHDGSQLVIAHPRGRVTSYNVQTKKTESQELRTKWNWNAFAVFSPDGQVLAYQSTDGMQVVLRSDSGKRRILNGHTSEVTAIAFSPDSRRVATADTKGRILIWDVATGKQAPVEFEHPGRIVSLSFAPDNVTLASGGRGDNEAADDVYIWKVGSQEKRVLQQHTDEIRALSFSPHGGTLVSGSDDGTAIVWDTRTWRPLRTLRRHDGGVRAVAFSPNTAVFATGGRDNKVFLWDSSTLALLDSLRGHSGIINSMVFSPDGQTLASTGQDYSLILWNVDVNAERGQIECTTAVYQASFCRELNVLAYRPFGEGVRFRKLSNGRALNFETIPDTVLKSATNFALSDIGVLAVAVEDRAHVYDLVAGKLLFSVKVDSLATSPASSGRTMALTSDGVHLAVIDRDGNGNVWDVRKKTLEFKTKDHLLRALRFSQDGTLMVTGEGSTKRLIAGPRVTLWRIRDGTPLKEFSGHKDTVMSVDLSRDNRLLVSGSFDNSLRVWDVRSEKEYVLIGHSASVHDVCFSPDGKTLVSAGGDRTIRFWDVGTLQQRAVFREHLGAVRVAVWSDDGQTLLTGSDDKTIRIWRSADREEGGFE